MPNWITQPGYALWIVMGGMALVASCAISPVTGKNELALITEADELRLGRENDVEIRRQYGVYQNPALQAYVQQLGARVAAHSHRPKLEYRFTILDSADVNAFALPGGYIYVTRGILAHLNTEAELAAVLGHEIGHVTARHAVRQYSAAVAGNVGVAVTSLFVPELGSRVSQTLVGLIGNALLSGYGRDHELEADHLGAEYLARTGYDPRAMLDVLSLLKNQELFEKEVAAREHRPARIYHGVFASHPSADQRLQEVVAVTTRPLTDTGDPPRGGDFLQRLDGLAYGDSESQGVRRGSSFFHLGLGVALRFPAEWHLTNTSERLIARRPDGDAFMEMQVAPRGRTRTPKEYVVVDMQMHDIRDMQSFTVHGSPAFAATTTGRTPFGVRDVQVAAIFRRGHVYRFLGTSRHDGAEFRIAFHDAVQSLHALDATERRLAHGQKIRLVTARRGDTVARLARRSSLGPHAESQLRLLNNLYPEGEPVAGARVKVVR